MATSTFTPNTDESILYQSQLSRGWTSLTWRVGGGILMVVIFCFFSLTTFAGLTRQILAFFLSPSGALISSEILCMGLAPILVVGWFVEDTIQALTAELVLTDQRIWIKRSPYTWSGVREIPLEDIQSIRCRRDGLIIRRKSSRKPQAHLFPDGKQIVQAYEQVFGKPGAD